MADIVTLAKEALKAQGSQQAQALSQQAVSGEADDTAIIAQEHAVPTWRQRAYNTQETPVGKPYKWQGQVYKLWQQHGATEQPDWSPDKAPSLWDVCHTTDPAKAKEYTPPQGSRGLWQKEECCVQTDRVWRCVQNDCAYSPSDMPQYWTDLGSVQELQEGEGAWI